MKKLNVGLLTLVFLISGTLTYAQKHAKKGDYTFLAGVKAVTVQFDYSDMKVGKNLNEDDYVKDKVDAHNKDEAGKGDKWKENWYGNRDKRYEPKFMELINKQAEKYGMKFSEGEDGDNVLIVHTTYTEPGWNVGVMKVPAAVSFEFVFMQNGSEKAKYIIERVPGSQAAGFDFDMGSRLAESYAKAGKMLGSYIGKDLK